MSTHETIGPAAICYGGQIFTGVNHLEAYEKLKHTLPDMLDAELTQYDGFITNTGRYVCRKEALTIAKAAMQLSGSQPTDATVLQSEYLQR